METPPGPSPGPSPEPTEEYTPEPVYGAGEVAFGQPPHESPNSSAYGAIAGQVPSAVLDLTPEGFVAVDAPWVTVANYMPGRGIAINSEPANTWPWQRIQGGRVLPISAYLDLKGRPLVVIEENPPRILAGLHPSELYEWFVDPNPAVPTPRVLLVGGDDALERIKTLTEWARYNALQLTVSDNDEAQRALEWLNAGWRIVAADQLTVWAVRAFG